MSETEPSSVKRESPEDGHQTNVTINQEVLSNEGNAVGANIDHADNVYLHVERSLDIEPYLRWLAADCRELTLSALNFSEASVFAENPVQLEAVYIDLEVETPVAIATD